MRIRKIWTPDELEKLRELWTTTTKEELVATFGRKFDAIRMKALELGLGKRPAKVSTRARWTLEEDLILERDWGRRPIHAIAKDIGRTINGVVLRAQARKLGPPDMSGRVTLRDLAKRTGYSEHSLKIAAKRAGVLLRRKWTVRRADTRKTKGGKSWSKAGLRPHYSISEDAIEKILAVLHPVHANGRGGWGTRDVPEKCIGCGTKDVPHHAKGRCGPCDSKHRNSTPEARERKAAQMRERRARARGEAT